MVGDRVKNKVPYFGDLQPGALNKVVPGGIKYRFERRALSGPGPAGCDYGWVQVEDF